MAIDDDLLNEHEQSERVRNWVRSNALAMLGGILFALALIGGWQWWQGQKLQDQMQLSERFDQTARLYASGALPQDKGKAALAALADGNPTLGTLAALQLAGAQVDAGRAEDAIATLRGLSKVDPDLQPVVQERLARLLIDAGKAKDALQLLADERNPAMLDVRGDAQFVLGDRAKAREAYLKALALVDVGDPQHQLLTMKLIEAGGTPPHTEDKT